MQKKKKKSCCSAPTNVEKYILKSATALKKCVGKKNLQLPEVLISFLFWLEHHQRMCLLLEAEHKKLYRLAL